MRERHDEKNAKVGGIVLTVVSHALMLIVVSVNGMSYLYPPPPETSMLIDFERDEEVSEIDIPKGREARVEEPDPSRPVELVQKSEAPYVSKADNLTPETKKDDHGDVTIPTPETKEEPKLDPRASFPGMAKKDTSVTAPHSSDKAVPEFKGGKSAGNTTNGNTDGKPNAKLKGRTVTGVGLPRPEYKVQEQGVVVVTIKVDQYGNVTNAVPGAEGTTVSNKDLWNAARNAAMKAHFNADPDAPAVQEGTITYNFILK